MGALKEYFDSLVQSSEQSSAHKGTSPEPQLVLTERRPSVDEAFSPFSDLTDNSLEPDLEQFSPSDAEVGSGEEQRSLKTASIASSRNANNSSYRPADSTSDEEDYTVEQDLVQEQSDSNEVTFIEEKDSENKSSFADGEGSLVGEIVAPSANLIIGPISRPINLQSIFKSQTPLSITISDDQSVTEKIQERHLLALRLGLRRPQSLPRDRVNLDEFLSWLYAEGSQSKALKKPKLDFAMIRHEVPEATKLALAEVRPSASIIGNGIQSEKGSDVSGKEGSVDDMNLDQLQSYIQRLQKRATTMGSSSRSRIYRHQVLYRILRWVESSKNDGGGKRVLSQVYSDPPELLVGQGNVGSLRCTLPVDNFELYLEKNKDICAIVYHTYVEPTRQELDEVRQRKRVRSYAPTVNISVSPLSVELKDAVVAALESVDGCSVLLQSFRSSTELTAPYHFFHHFRDEFEQIAASLESSVEPQFRILMDHIQETDGEQFEAADAMISQGDITPRNAPYLLKPGDILIYRQNDQYSGWVAMDWAQERGQYRRPRSVAQDMVAGRRNVTQAASGNFTKTRNDDVMIRHWTVRGWQWQFDGAFSRRSETLVWHLQQELVDYEEEKAGGQLPAERTPPIPIQDTKIMPLKCCPPNIVDQLRRRGDTFWKCRDRQFVNYSHDDSDISNAEDRYMVDLKTYRDLHKDNQYDVGMSKHAVRDDLGEEAMKQDRCPEEQFDLLLPPTIKGYHLQRKKWYDLKVDRITDVVWAKEAFSKIVMDPKAKEIVRALISKQLASERSTDLVSGKGNGLILLLHGGPGTGKTLTAESVAEIAEKPLYRVTCGDVGTKAEDVEKYLESVFHLGKRWGCVVLLDEADVFLEQRDLKDLERNALVSVFLRTLEYYEGIMVLTSNRVGTFDEAFRSRIQLALHYPTLKQSQRLRIWENFIDRLESFNDGTVNITDLKFHLEDLAEREMNGREIRNVITTARQYAEYMGSILTYSQLKDVIDISARFDTYLADLNGGLTNDEIAKDDGIR